MCLSYFILIHLSSFNLHIKAFLEALVCMISWFTYAMNVVNVVMFYLVIISDATKEFLPGDDQD